MMYLQLVGKMAAMQSRKSRFLSPMKQIMACCILLNWPLSVLQFLYKSLFSETYYMGDICKKYGSKLNIGKMYFSKWDCHRDFIYRGILQNYKIYGTKRALHNALILSILICTYLILFYLTTSTMGAGVGREFAVSYN